MSRLAATLALLCLALPAYAEAPPWAVPEVRSALEKRYHLITSSFIPNGLKLSELVRLERTSFAGATVVAGFYDYRSVSRYRSRPGLHLGYDIAMPYGTPVLAGWAGVVTAIVPWYGSEYGVTVRHPDGTQITYGHVSPKVEVGQSVKSGDKVATIEYNHVDVKMRDAQGAPFDFGDSVQPGPPPPPAKPLTHDEMLAQWLVYRGQWLASLQELKTSAAPKVRAATLTRKIHDLEEKDQNMPGYLAQGLVSQRELEETHAELISARREAKGLSSRGGGREKMKELSLAKDQVARQLLKARRQAEAAGLTWDDARQLAQRLVAADPKLQKAVAGSRLTSDDDLGEVSLAEQVKTGKAHLTDLEHLYEIGGIARTTLEEAQADQKMLEEELRLLRSLVGPKG